MYVFVSSKSDIKSIDELIKAAKTRTLKVAGVSIGGVNHQDSYLMQKEFGINYTYVPYKVITSVLPDVISPINLLLRVPGAPANAATMLDGTPMVERGEFRQGAGDRDLGKWHRWAHQRCGPRRQHDHDRAADPEVQYRGVFRPDGLRDRHHRHVVRRLSPAQHAGSASRPWSLDVRPRSGRAGAPLCLRNTRNAHRIPGGAGLHRAHLCKPGPVDVRERHVVGRERRTSRGRSGNEHAAEPARAVSHPLDHPAFGILGLAMEKCGLPIVPLSIALLLGPQMEVYFRQSLIGNQGAFLQFFTRPICIVLWIFVLLSPWSSLRGPRSFARRSLARRSTA